jgi:spore germination protein YaaH
MKLFFLLFVANVIAVFSQSNIPTHFPTRCFVDEPTITKSKKDNQSFSTNEALEKEVMGWHPYWASANAHKNYDYTVLNHLSYFGYELQSDGTISTYQSSTPDDSVIAYAKEQGCRTSITIICFDPNDFVAMYEDYDRTELFFQQLADIVERLEVDEVCFDFEPLANFPQDMIRDFLLEARFALYFLPSAEEIKLSMAMPPVDWSNNFNFEHYAEDLDKLIVMAYDYHYTNSPNAGPVAPLTGENYTVAKTIENYLLDVPKEKLIIAVPWYGYDWPVTSTQRKATASGAAISHSLAAMQPFVQQNSPTFDSTTKVPWLNYMQAQQQRQIWYEDSLSLGYKYLEIAKNDLAGVGIWALSYAGNQQYAWKEIRTQFEKTFTTISADVQTVEFNGVQIQTTSEQTITLTNTGNEELLVSEITLIGTDASAYTITEGKPSATPISVAPNETTTFKIQFAPTQVQPYNNATIVVVANIESNLTIPVRGIGTSENSVISVVANVQSVEFKAVTIQSTSEQTITLTNTGNAELLISDIAILGSDANVYSIIEGKPSSTPISVAPNETTTFKVQFAPIEVKTYNNATLSVVSNAPEHLTIPLSGEGTPLTSVRSESVDENFKLRLVGQNPISSVSAVEITTSVPTNGEVTISIVDASGATVLPVKTIQLGVGTVNIPFSLVGLASGSYMIVAKMNGEVYTIPIRVTR